MEDKKGMTNEGHDEPGKAHPTLKKGEFQQVGSAVPLSQKPFSPNQKSGSPGGDER